MFQKPFPNDEKKEEMFGTVVRDGHSRSMDLRFVSPRVFALLCVVEEFGGGFAQNRTA